MLFKDKTVAFIHRSAEKLKLTYQSTLQAVQLLNLIEIHHSILHLQHTPLTFPSALLSLCCKLHEVNPVPVRQFAKLIHPNYRHFEVQQLQKDEQEQSEPTNLHSLKYIQSQIKQWELKVMLLLKWKIAVPLLYDQVVKIAVQWDKYTSFLQDFPLRFETENGNQIQSSSNHNYLASRVCICVYNMSHLLKGTALDQTSDKCRRLAVALFAVLIRQLMKQKFRLKQYILSPKYSVEHILNDFAKLELQVDLKKLKTDTDTILATLQNYKAFKESSREKEDRKVRLDKLKSKKPTSSQKISEEKQNYPYYITLGNKSKNKKRCGSQLNEKSKKNHSRSKKEKTNQIKQIKTYCLKDNSKILKQNNIRQINNNIPKYLKQSTKDIKQNIKDMKQSIKDIKECNRELKDTHKQKQNKKSNRDIVAADLKQNTRILKEKAKMIKQRGSVIKTNKKKSSSTKSILSKNVSTLKHDSKATLPNPPLKTDKLPFSRSRASKRSDKSHLNSKLLANPTEDQVSTKSTYWLRSTTLVKTDKKLSNSSTRMKMR